MQHITKQHVFAAVAQRKDFLDEIPKAIYQAVADTIEILPYHPPFAVGCVAHFIAHRRIAEAAPTGFYAEAHEQSQCRGTILFPEQNRRYTLLLASGYPDGGKLYRVHRKGSMTSKAAALHPSLFPLDEDFVMLSEDVLASPGCFFVIVERFRLPHADRIKCHLLWGRLLDETTVYADFAMEIGETDLPTMASPPITPKDLPPVADAKPILEFLNIEHE